MILPRVLTAIALIPLVLAVFWSGSIPFFLFVLGVCLLCNWEFSLICEDGGYPNQLVLGLAGTIVVLVALFFDGIPQGPVHKAPTPIFIFVLWTLGVFIREFFRRDKNYSLLRSMTTIFGVILCALFLGHLLLVRDLRLVGGEGFRDVGRELAFFLLFVVWGVDIGAWVTGLLIGRHKMAPQISPKKTWEGAFGGTLIACGVGWLCREIFLSHGFGPVEAIFYSLVIAITSQMSDLIESMLKRTLGVKDTSRLLPGHGGILDRFDSFIFSTPIFYYLLIGTGRFK